MSAKEQILSLFHCAPVQLTGLRVCCAFILALLWSVFEGFGNPLVAQSGVIESFKENDRSPRVYTISRITGETPTIDGVLDEECWQLGEWQGDFRQRAPLEGSEPADQTEIKLLYDDEAIFVAIRAYVPDVENRDRQIGRRDNYAGDMVGVAFDSYFDRRTAFQFNVSGGRIQDGSAFEPRRK
jgi:hypothetical protein